MTNGQRKIQAHTRKIRDNLSLDIVQTHVNHKLFLIILSNNSRGCDGSVHQIFLIRFVFRMKWH
jgi:hypothetical protein